MPDREDRVTRLVEEILELGSDAEEACAGEPELVADVRERLDRLQRVEREIDALFPAPTSPVERGDSMPELPTLSGYEIEGVLGRGGMGVVFKARHLKLSRPVAVKMLLAGAYAGATERARFRREAEAIASLRHPNIVHVYDVGEEGGRAFFTMELVDGGSLAQKLDGAPRPPREAAELAAVLASAVQAAHDEGIAHRDLKPANVLLAADGTPKISDFGLARRFGHHDGEGSGRLTLSGARVGTPSYMAPEQAMGRAGALGPSADVYSLGAILYETLTGRPPFSAETASEIERLVISADPVRPSRLEPRVPRDLETICLVCLRKEPARRYGSAGALADDLRRFLRGEPIAARRTGVVERVAKWVRRRPAAAAAVAAGALLASGTIGFLWWRASERAAIASAVEADLAEVAGCQARSAWTVANAALDRAAARLGGRDLDDLLRRVELGRADLAWAARLERIRLDRSRHSDGDFDEGLQLRRADAAYAAVFSESGVGAPGEGPASVAARIAESPVRTAWVAALDDWAVCARHSEDRTRPSWVLEVARLADPDPTGWRDRARDPGATREDAAIDALVRDARIESEPATLLVALAERLFDAGAGTKGVPFLKRVQAAHPDDFWVNLRLGAALGPIDPADALGYLRVAVALRPDSPAATASLGAALGAVGRNDEALEVLRDVVARVPELSHGWTNLGNVLLATGKIDEAIAAFELAIELEPESVGARTNLGKALLEADRHEAALEAFAAAAAMEPESPSALNGIALSYRALGRTDEAIETLERALRVEPEMAHLHHNLGLVQGDAGRVEEAATALREAIRLDPQNAEAHLQLGIIAGDSGRIAEAVERFEASIRIDPKDALPYGALAQARIVQRRFAEALSAAKRYAELLPESDPRHAGAGLFVARCERFVALEARLPALLRGGAEPEDANEALDLGELCRMLGLNAASARFTASGLAADTPPDEARVAAQRYDAASAAALAARGEGEDARDLDPAERARCRALAREWLRADLAAIERAIAAGSAPALAWALRTLARWTGDPDLAAVRDPEALAALDAEERAACEALWRDVAAAIERARGGE